jgi:hypothetical protein
MADFPPAPPEPGASFVSRVSRPLPLQAASVVRENRQFGVSDFRPVGSDFL